MSDESRTRLTLDTILERLNALGTELRGSIESLRQEVNGSIESLRLEVRGEIGSFRQEVQNNTESLRQEVNGNVESLRQEVNAFRVVVEDRLEQIETRLDRSQGIALEARADVRELRADLRNQFKQPA